MDDHKLCETCGWCIKCARCDCIKLAAAREAGRAEERAEVVALQSRIAELEIELGQWRSAHESSSAEGEVSAIERGEHREKSDG